MEPDSFDRRARSITASSSRRWVLRGLIGAGSGLAGLRLFAVGQAKKRKKKDQPKGIGTLNKFGCQDVGETCRGKNAFCCSGICVGKTPKQGQKDNSRCRDHDTSDCEAGIDHCYQTIGCTTSAGNPGTCGLTTGYAAYCFDVLLNDKVCKRDVDCYQALGATAACIECLVTGEARCAGILHP